MKRLVSLSMLLIMVLLTSIGCASTKDSISEVVEPLGEVCEIYEVLRPQVVAWKAWAIEHRDQLPAEQFELLVEINGYLPKLDQAGKDVCAVSNGLDLIGASGARDEWDKALSAVLRAASIFYDVRSGAAPQRN